MTQLLHKSAWEHNKGDTSPEKFHMRLRKQNKEWQAIIQEHGHCFMVKYGDSDIRPLWEDQIIIDQLKLEVRAPDGLPWECPFCQPYDAWYNRSLIRENRRYLCRIIYPDNGAGCVEDDGTFAKCICLKSGKRTHKFKKENK